MLEAALLSYVGVMSITPGPNNLMLATSGVNYGFRRTLPHMLGISLGCSAQVFITASLLAWALQWIQAARLPLAVAGCIYLLWLSWKIARSAAPQGGEGGKPMSFLAAALFQWVNPKAWVMAVGAITTYTPAQGYVTNVIVIAALFALVNLPSVGVWVMFGSALRNLLQNPRWLMLFNVLMALLLVISLYPLLFVESAFS